MSWMQILVYFIIYTVIIGVVTYLIIKQIKRERNKKGKQ